MAGVQIKLDGYETLLAKLNQIEAKLSGKLGRDMVQAAGEIVAAKAKTLVPVGDPSHHKGDPPLRSTIGVLTRDYGPRAVAFVGPEYPAGAHGHLVEEGHDIVPRGESKNKGRGRRSGAKKKGGTVVGRAQPDRFLRPAFDSTKGQQLRAMSVVMERAIKDLNGG